MSQAVGTAWVANQKGESTSGPSPDGRVAPQVPFPVCLHSAARGGPAVCSAFWRALQGTEERPNHILEGSKSVLQVVAIQGWVDGPYLRSHGRR